MVQWIRCPPLLRRRMAGTLLVGIGSICIGVVVFILSRDSVLLSLSGMILLGCLFQCGSLWRMAARGEYETVSGLCTGISNVPFRSYRKIVLLDEEGNETTLLLGKQQRIKPGASYRFYFRRNGPATFGNDYLDAMLSVNGFLGYEELF